MSTTPRPRAPLPRRRLFPLTLFIAAVAFLAFAGAAFAETKIGEYVGARNLDVPAEANVLGATGEYDSLAGSLSLAVTTAAEPKATIEGKPNEIEMKVGFATLPVCSFSELLSGNVGYPLFEVDGFYAEPLALAKTA
ncbi:MAG TPA: hypothetical protein VN671_12440, partial [Solirubrobacterales bacterium]|nr:hypothetical protein [Solirubrobacterales bacterium]